MDQQIEFYTEGIDFSLEQEEEVISWIARIIHTHEEEIAHINYIFCSDAYLLELNKSHLDHDYYTDILTFPYSTSPLLADIYISIDRIKDNAQSLSVSFTDELHRVMAHGILHLLGYDDHSEEDVEIMRKQEEEALAQRDFLS